MIYTGYQYKKQICIHVLYKINYHKPQNLFWNIDNSHSRLRKYEWCFYRCSSFVPLSDASCQTSLSKKQKHNQFEHLLCNKNIQNKNTVRFGGIDSVLHLYRYLFIWLTLLERRTCLRKMILQLWDVISSSRRLCVCMCVHMLCQCS